MLTGERSKSTPGRPDSRPPRASWRHASSAVRRSRPPRSVSAGPQTARASRCLQTSGRSPRRSRPCATERRAAACCEPSSCSWIVSRRPTKQEQELGSQDRKSTRLNSSHDQISYAVFCLKKKKKKIIHTTESKKQQNKTTDNTQSNEEIAQQNRVHKTRQGDAHSDT